MQTQAHRTLWTAAVHWAGGQDPDWSLPVARILAMIRSATLARLVFAFMIALPALVVAPAASIVAWLSALVLWELLVRGALEDRLVVPAGDTRPAMHWLAAIHFLGGAIYVVFPFLVWSPSQPIGMVLATAWVCASANHAFVYFAANRTLLFATLAPLTFAGVAAPLLGDGGVLTPTACIGSIALIALIFASALFGRDRRVLLKALSAETAARVQADAANATKSRFLANVSDELRTPLDAIIGYAELIEEADAAPDAAADAAKIRLAARGLLDQINTILDVSRLQAGDVAFNPHRCVLSEILRAAAAAAEPLAAANQNRLHVRIGQVGSARIDALQLSRCLARLLSNAARFTKEGDITLSATRIAGDGRDLLSIAVADTGIGIPAHLHDAIFAPLADAAPAAGRREGAGLGLAHARLLARLMGGDIVCKSAPGAGSTFTLTIPLQD